MAYRESQIEGALAIVNKGGTITSDDFEYFQNFDEGNKTHILKVKSLLIPRFMFEAKAQVTGKSQLTIRRVPSTKVVVEEINVGNDAQAVYGQLSAWAQEVAQDVEAIAKRNARLPRSQWEFSGNDLDEKEIEFICQACARLSRAFEDLLSDSYENLSEDEKKEFADTIRELKLQIDQVLIRLTINKSSVTRSILKLISKIERFAARHQLLTPAITGLVVVLCNQIDTSEPNFELTQKVQIELNQILENHTNGSLIPCSQSIPLLQSTALNQGQPIDYSMTSDSTAKKPQALHRHDQQ